MKRHQLLLALSREHHSALRLSNHIIKQPDVFHHEEILAHKDYLLEHFAQEEEELVNFWEQLPNTQTFEQFTAEHVALRNLLARPQMTLKEQLEFAHLLNQHVRFEERVLFPEIQEYCLKDL